MNDSMVFTIVIAGVISSLVKSNLESFPNLTCFKKEMHFVCMYVCMHACMSLSIYVSIYHSIYVYIYIYIYIYIYEDFENLFNILTVDNMPGFIEKNKVPLL